MIASSLGTFSLLVSVLAGLAILAGGIVLFAVGKGRGALSGAGFLVLGVATVVSTVLSLLGPWLSSTLHIKASTVPDLYGGVTLIFSLVGWGLVITALLKFRSEPPESRTPPPYGPGWGGPASGTQGPPPPPGV